jgi:hypothetical protein
MRVVTKEFLNENAYLSYPIDFRATYEPYSKEDVSVINSVLLDMKLTVPDDLATTAFVASIKVTNALVSMIIMGAKEAPYYDMPPAEPDYSSEEYDAFSAIVLATVTVSKATALQQNPIKLQGNVEGVGGWVVFGPGVQNNASWSFPGPASSAIDSSAINKYKYQGVKSLAKKEFEQTLTGPTFITGQNGIEVVRSGKNTLSIQFTGTTTDIKDSLSEYKGECGIRPETDTCAFTPIRTINNIPPKISNQGKNEVVLVLDLPIYGTLKDVRSPSGAFIPDGGFTVTSDVPLESLCPSRLAIPEIDCVDSNQAPLRATIPAIPFNTEIILETTSIMAPESHVFSMYQQHPTRNAISIFLPKQAVNILGEVVKELHIDHDAKAWQAYTQNGPSLNLFGPLEVNLNGHRSIELNGIPTRVAVGRVNILDQLEFNNVAVSVNSTDVPEWVGTYVRDYLGHYSSLNSKKYVLRVSPLNNAWSIYSNGAVVVGGTFDEKGVGISVQNYRDSNNQPQVRAVTAAGVA